MRFAGDKLNQYEVQKGDTLYGLARRHGTSVDALASANNITDINNISIGQRLNLGAVTPNVAPEPPHPIQETPSLESGLSPQRRATLDTLSWAEGTWNDETQSPNYAMRFGDARNSAGSLDVTQPHPRDVVASPWGGSRGSNASGAYQFLDNTWEETNDGQNAVMSPINQDNAASALVDQTGWDDNKGFREQAPLLSGRWASIPNDRGVSNYNQPVKSLDSLDNFYQSRLSAHSAPKVTPISSVPNNPVNVFGARPSAPAPSPAPVPMAPVPKLSADQVRVKRRGTAFK